MKNCAKCGVEIDNRKKFCSDSCKYWFNVCKKEEEIGLPPFKKRNKNYFSMITGYEQAKSGGLRQGRRSGGTCTGGMSARINCTTEIWSEVNYENIKKHFTCISFYTPDNIRLGNGITVSK